MYSVKKISKVSKISSPLNPRWKMAPSICAEGLPCYQCSLPNKCLNWRKLKILVDTLCVTYLKSESRRENQPLRKISPSKYEASVFWATFLEEPYIQYLFLYCLFPAKLMVISYCTLLNELGYDRVDLPNSTRKG